MRIIGRLIPENIRNTFYLRYFGLTKIPLLFYVRPSVVEKSGERVVIKIPLGRKSKNHHGSMYFAALAMGADCAAGLLAVELINRQEENISFIFKEFNAEFYRRATGDVFFSCDQGSEIAELVKKATLSTQRVEKLLNAIATVPTESDEPVARFRLILSLKRSDA